MFGPSPQTGTTECEHCNLCSTCCRAAPCVVLAPRKKGMQMFAPVLLAPDTHSSAGYRLHSITAKPEHLHLSTDELRFTKINSLYRRKL